MFAASSKPAAKEGKEAKEAKTPAPHVGWGPAAAIWGTVLIYAFGQLLAGLIFVVIFMVLGRDSSDWDNWFSSTFGRFSIVAATAAFTIWGLWLFLKKRKSPFAALGFARRPRWRDGRYVLAGFAVYFLLLVAASIIAKQLMGIDTDQEQDVGFKDSVAGGQLALVFVSLVVLPPIIEEMLFRGFLFTGLRRKLTFVWATVITSLLFAAPHLLGGVGGLLWIGAIDTFILSLVLCYVREQSGALWASIGIHAIKNALAFVVLFVVQ